jgi:hypothetical protein
LLIYERITGESFIPTSLNSVVVFFYSCIIAADKDLVFSYNDFLDWLDEKPLLLTEFSNFLMEKMEMNNSLANNDSEKGNENKESKKKS